MEAGDWRHYVKSSKINNYVYTFKLYHKFEKATLLSEYFLFSTQISCLEQEKSLSEDRPFTTLTMS